MRVISIPPTRMCAPPGVQGTEFIEGYADVLKSDSCAKLLKLSDNVTLTRAFTRQDGGNAGVLASNRRALVEAEFA